MRLTQTVALVQLVVLVGCSKAPPSVELPPPSQPAPAVPAATTTPASPSRAATKQYWVELARLVRQAPNWSPQAYAAACFESSRAVAGLKGDGVDETARDAGRAVENWFSHEGGTAVRLRELSETARILTDRAIREGGQGFTNERDQRLAAIMADEELLVESFYFRPAALMDLAYPRPEGRLLPPTPAEEAEAARQRDEYLQQLVEKVRSGHDLFGDGPPPSLRAWWAVQRLRLAVLIHDRARSVKDVNDRVRAARQKLSSAHELAELPVIGEGLVSLKPRDPEPGLIAAIGANVPRLFTDRHVSNALAFSPDGKTLVSGGDQVIDGVVHGRELKAWDVATLKEVWSLPTSFLDVHSVAFSPDGKTLAIVQYWSSRLKGGGYRTSYDVSLLDIAARRTTAVWNGRQRSMSLAFLPGSQTLALTQCKNPYETEEHYVLLKDLASNRSREAPLPQLAGREMSLRLSPDGRLLAAAEPGKPVEVFDVASGNRLATVEGCFPVAFSPDGKTVASSTTDRRIKLYGLPDGKVTAAIDDPSHAQVEFLCFSPDGKVLASAGGRGDSNPVRLWDAASGKGIAAFPGHKGPVRAVAFSPDGKILATGGDDKTVKLWDVAG